MKPKPYISAKYINNVFYKPTYKHRVLTGQMISALLLTGFGFYLLVNTPAVSQQFGYWYEHDIKASQRPARQPSSAGVTNNEISQLTTVVSVDSRSPIQTAPHNLPDNTIYIPKLKIKAPIIWDVTAGGDLNSDLIAALRHGVVRYPKTALPDQVGNVFLTGHSSDYWWEKGGYKTIFALLNRLVVGDMVYINYQNQLYNYRVKGQKVIKPSETSVLAATSTPTLSLMTCTPTGTTLFRRIVTAELISPMLADKIQLTAPADSQIRSVR